MSIRTLMRLAVSCVFTSLLAACGGGGHFTPVTTPAAAFQPVQQDNGGIQTMSFLQQPSATSFAPSSWGKIGTFQIFDETRNGSISSTAAAAHGYHYSAVWGVRPGLGATWRISNPGLKSAYYFIAVTDASTTSWGGVGHSLTWWQSHHPTWVLYACTSAGAPTHTLASVIGLPNVPLDIRNSSVVNYQVRSLVAPYAATHGYSALAADEVTYWFAGSGGPGYYPCGIWSGKTFVRRYTGPHDQSYATDMVNWVKSAHSILRTYFPTLKLIVNHPASGLTANEQTLLANVDGDMDESGFTDYGRYHNTRFLMETAWMRYAQQHGTTVLINQGWGTLSMGAAQIDYSVATYLMGNEQAAAAFIAPHTGYGIEVWRSEYATSMGAPCAEYYGGPSYSATSPAVYYRRFANALVVVNAGTTSTQYAHLPTNHTYVDLERRAVRNPLPLAPNDGYVLKTTNGCN